MANTKQVKSVNPLNQCIYQVTFTSGDGDLRINTAHPTIAGTVSNELATAADLMKLH